jgi:small subunit ribosomal protein S18
MKQCHFCTNNIKEIDYKDLETLKQFMDTHARIIKHKKSGLCSLHQRRLATAIKRARSLSLLPFILG